MLAEFARAGFVIAEISGFFSTHSGVFLAIVSFSSSFRPEFYT
ncbi:MAG TPA: hypothetical protein VF452_02755 [Candidatus Binatia bacterium]